MTTTGSVDTATAALRRAIYYLDRSLAPAPKVRAFRTALSVVEGLGDDELDRHLAARSITELDGIGPSTGAVITEAFGDGSKPGYLSKLEASTRLEVGEGAELRTRLRGDCHLHSTWSDGGASIEDMARTAIDLGHEYIVLTDHSPRLTIAHGLSQERLDEQRVEVERLNELLSPFRILRGVEVDILEDGTLDHSDEVLAGLDIVVASVHSKLKMPADQMTRRMVMAVANPNVDILGHCTGRQIVGTHCIAVHGGVVMGRHIAGRHHVLGEDASKGGAGRDSLPAGERREGFQDDAAGFFHREGFAGVGRTAAIVQIHVRIPRRRQSQLITYSAGCRQHGLLCRTAH